MLAFLLPAIAFAGSNNADEAADYVVTSGEQITLDATTQNVESYFWMHSGETTPSVSISTEGLNPGFYSYSVLVTNEFGCETEAQVTVKVTAVSETEEGFSSIVYPNPTSGTINYDLVSLPDHNYSVTLFNANGELVYSQDEYSSADFSTGSLDLTSCNPGVYFVHFSGTDFQSVQKVVLQ